MNIIFSYGMEAAYFRFAADKDSVRDKTIFSTPFLSLLTTSVVFSLIIISLRSWLGGLVNPYHTVSAGTIDGIIALSASILFFDALTILPFASLRLQHKPVHFSVLRFINIFLQVVLNVLFVVGLRYGIMGIFLGNALASFITFLCISPVVVQLFSFSFSKKVLMEFLSFGLPYVPSAISTIVLQVIDRPIMQHLTDDAHVGIYSANYRLGTIMMIFVSMFEYAWRPFFLQYASQPDAKRVFSRVLTYFTLIGAVIFLLVSFFIGDIAHFDILGRHTIIDHRYWGGLPIVPIVLAAYIFNGFYTNMIVGIYIEKRTKLLPLITGAAALSNIIGNFILIPLMGIAGAAWATFISYALMAYLIFRATQGFYPMTYEWDRIVKIGLIMLAAFCLSLVAQSYAEGMLLISYKILLLALVAGAFFAFKFFSKGEIATLKTMFGGLSGDKK